MINRYRKQISMLCILAMLAMTGCSSKSKDSASEKEIEVEEVSEPIQYTMDVVRRGNVSNDMSVSCSYMQMKEEDISFSMDGGRIYQVYVDKGDTVKKGDLLVELDVEELEAKIEDAEYNLAYQKLLLKQTKEQLDYEIQARKERYAVAISGTNDSKQITTLNRSLTEDIESIQKNYATKIEDSEDEITINQYKLDAYNEELNNSRLYASIDGTVSFVKDNLYNSLTEADEKIMTVIDTSLCAFISEKIKYKDYFEEDTPVTISTGFSSTAKEYEAYPVNKAEWEDEMYFQLTEQDYELEIGTRGSMMVTLESAEDVLYISSAAVHQAGDDYYVYMVDDEGMRSVQYIEVGVIGKQSVEIVSGLNEGDYVVLK